MGMVWQNYWPEFIGVLFVVMWLGGYAVRWIVSDYLALRRWIRSRQYQAFQDWLRFHPTYEPIVERSLDGMIVAMQRWEAELRKMSPPGS